MTNISEHWEHEHNNSASQERDEGELKNETKTNDVMRRKQPSMCMVCKRGIILKINKKNATTMKR